MHLLESQFAFLIVIEKLSLASWVPALPVGRGFFFSASKSVNQMVMHLLESQCAEQHNVVVQWRQYSSKKEVGQFSQWALRHNVWKWKGERTLKEWTAMTTTELEQHTPADDNSALKVNQQTEYIYSWSLFLSSTAQQIDRLPAALSMVWVHPWVLLLPDTQEKNSVDEATYRQYPTSFRPDSS